MTSFSLFVEIDLPANQREVYCKSSFDDEEYGVDVKADGDDGICDGEDICPVNANNDCVVIEGIVNGGGSAIANAQVELGNGGNTVFTSLSGDFSGNIQAGTLSSDGSRQFFPINVTAQGFATGNAKVPFIPGQLNYSIVISLQQVSDTIDESEDVTQSGGIEINSGVNIKKWKSRGMKRIKNIEQKFIGSGKNIM